eukprot:TRINITY_DN35390_c0_g1_i1.p1 TRINITY_DN35390_c0_g1~~TRINITY_DN35390_c0_g1_i1.p1  ORF type:complete len:761 (+),score=150.05 TRINITY_DN35390_c0_g1_i1:108-2390(+)
MKSERTLPGRIAAKPTGADVPLQPDLRNLLAVPPSPGAPRRARFSAAVHFCDERSRSPSPRPSASCSPSSQGSSITVSPCDVIEDGDLVDRQFSESQVQTRVSDGVAWTYTSGSSIRPLNVLDYVLPTERHDEATGRAEDDELELALEHARGLWSPELKRSPICFKIVTDELFEPVITVLVVASFITLAIVVDLEAAPSPGASPGLDLTRASTAEGFFLVFFVMEMIMRYLGCPYVQRWRDLEMVVDGFVTAAAVLDKFILRAMYASDFAHPVSPLRCLRTLQLVRLIRLARLWTRTLQLKAAITRAFLDTLWVLIMVLIFTFGFAIVFAGTVGVLPEPVEGEAGAPDTLQVVTPDEAFNSIISSLATLNTILLRGMRWGPTLMQPLFASDNELYVISGLVLLLFVTFTLICLVNIIFGMFMSSVLESLKQMKQRVDRATLIAGQESMKQLQEVFMMMDGNGDGLLSREEFEDGLQRNPDISEALGISPEEAGRIFDELMVTDSSRVSIDEYMLGLLKFTRASKTLDMLGIHHQQQKISKEIIKARHSYEHSADKFGLKLADVVPRMERVGHAASAFNSEMEAMLRRKSHRFASSPGGRDNGEGEGLATPLAGARHKAAKGRLSKAATTDALLKELQEAFNFQGRLDILNEDICEAIKQDKVPASQEADSGSELLVREMQSIVSSDVLPWVAREFAGQRKRMEKNIVLSAPAESPPSPASSQKRRSALAPALTKVSGTDRLSALQRRRGVNLQLLSLNEQ